MRFLSPLLLVFTASVVHAQSADAIVVPFDTISTRHMIVEVKVNGKGPYTLIFDTGAPSTLVSQRLAEDSGFLGKQKGGLASFFGNLGSKKAESVEMGPLRQQKVDVMVMDHPIVEAIARTEGRRIDGIIGYNIFGRYRMVIDYQNKKLTFVPSENRPTEMMALMMTLMFPSLDELEKTPLVNPKSLLGFQVEKKGSGPGVVVAKVFDGGPAARAGMKAGDRLLTLDGRWTDRVLDCHDAMSEVSPGRAVSAEIERDGKRLKLTLQPVAGF